MTTTKVKLRVNSGPMFRARVRPGIVGPAGPQGQQGIQGIPGGSVADGDKGDITVSGSGEIWTIDEDVVTYAKIQNISATARFLGRITAGAGNVEELTGTQATTLLDAFTSGLKGVAPASGGGTTNFLRSDGTWAAPPGTGGVIDGDKGDIVVSGSGAIWTIDSGVVTLAKLANMNTDRLIGRDTAASGVPEEISVGGGIEFTGSLGIQTSAFTGDVTKATGGTVTTIANDAVTYAKMQNISATARFIGRITAGAGDAEELTGTQATTLLDAFTSALKGLAPASGGGTTNFLRADGTWTSPTAVVADGDKGDITVSASGATWTVDNDVVTYAKMQNVSATARVLGRKTAAAGDTEECTLSEVLDFVGSPAQGDILYRGAATWTRLGAGTSGHFLKTQGAAANPIWADPAGSGNYSVADGRLTLSTGVPVMTSTVAATGTLYYTPHVGNKIGLYNGSSWDIIPSAEVSIALSGGTASKPHDVFAYNNAGTLTLEILAWTNDTTRATALTRQDGVYVKSGDATRRYLGSVYLNGSKQAQWTYGTLATGGGAGVFHLWNLYNRVIVSSLVSDDTDTWTYTTAAMRPANNSTTYRNTFLLGLSIDVVTSTYSDFISSVGSNAGFIAVGVDSTTVKSGQTAGGQSSATTNASNGTAIYSGYPGIGMHYMQALEYATGATMTFFGDGGDATRNQNGITTIWMA